MELTNLLKEVTRGTIDNVVGFMKGPMTDNEVKWIYRVAVGMIILAACTAYYKINIRPEYVKKMEQNPPIVRQSYSK